jgi:outer membrane protein
MKKIHFIICLILLAGTASAQRLTLEEAINIALKNSLDIQLLRNNVESSELNNYIGIAGGLPTVTAGVSNSEQVTNVNQKLNTGDVIERNGAAANNLAANVTAGMLLYNGSRVVATKKRLEQLFNQSEQYVNGQIQNTMAAVMTVIMILSGSRHMSKRWSNP